MKERGWSQNRMADHLGIKSGTLSQYLTGGRGMKLLCFPGELVADPYRLQL